MRKILSASTYDNNSGNLLAYFDTHERVEDEGYELNNIIIMNDIIRPD